jgi:hypothetical protein
MSFRVDETGTTSYRSHALRRSNQAMQNERRVGFFTRDAAWFRIEEPDADPALAEPSGPESARELAAVLRRLGYVQKRGHNERHGYSYVTAANLAGAVGRYSRQTRRSRDSTAPVDLHQDPVQLLRTYPFAPVTSLAKTRWRWRRWPQRREGGGFRKLLFRARR